CGRSSVQAPAGRGCGQVCGRPGVEFGMQQQDAYPHEFEYLGQRRLVLLAAAIAEAGSRDVAEILHDLAGIRGHAVAKAAAAGEADPAEKAAAPVDQCLGTCRQGNLVTWQQWLETEFGIIELSTTQAVKLREHLIIAGGVQIEAEGI